MPAWAEGPLELYLSVLMPWCFMVALLAYGRRFLRSSGRVGAYAAEASYPVYLLHQTVIVAVAFVVVRWEAGVALKFAAILCVSLLVTMLIYELAIRRVGATRFLFGMKPLRRTARASGVPAERSIRVCRGGPSRRRSAARRHRGPPAPAACPEIAHRGLKAEGRPPRAAGPLLRTWTSCRGAGRPEVPLSPRSALVSTAETRYGRHDASWHVAPDVPRKRGRRGHPDEWARVPGTAESILA